MKVKTVVIAVLVTGVVVAGIGYGIHYSMQSQKKPVKVVPVSNINMSYYGDMSSSYGSIISMSSQNIQLDSDYELVKVYVETGDEVKIGDPLLEYDMALVELQREMEDLTLQTLELGLTSMEKELQKLKNTTATASLSFMDSTMTASLDSDGLFEDGGEISDSVPEDQLLTAPQSAEGVLAETSSASTEAMAASGADIFEDPAAAPESEISEPIVSDPGVSGDSSQDQIMDPDPSQTETEPVVDEGTSDMENGDLILDSETEGGGETDPGSTDVEDGTSSDDVLIDSDQPQDGETDVDTEAVLSSVNQFLTRVNQLSAQELDQLIPSDISEALRIFREQLSWMEEQELVDVLGERRRVQLYTVKPQVAQLVGEATTVVLGQAYDRACVYQLIYHVLQIDPEKRPVSDLDEETFTSMEPAIRAAVDAYYGLSKSAFETYQEDLTSYIERLSEYVGRLNYDDVLQETESSSEPETDFPGDGGFGDFGDLGGDSGYTAEELKQAIREQEDTIKEQKLLIRESELKLRQYDRKLDNKIVKSRMDGVVTSAGSLDSAVSDEDFIVISGAAGLYLQGNVNELSLDTVHVGDVVNGTSYETGMSFSATITEISPYPNNSDNYYGYGENSNASYYPFLAYIENSEGLSEGEVEYQIVKNISSGEIFLEKALIREDASGKQYVYLQGEDGLLKKQYVETGITVYGNAMEILQGVTLEDKIAFPYGKGVEEGAKTEDADSFYSNYGY